MKKYFGHQTKETEQIEERKRQALRNMVKQEKHSRDIRGFIGRLWNKSASARPDELLKKAKTDISSGREEDGMSTNMCPCGTTQK